MIDAAVGTVRDSGGRTWSPGEVVVLGGALILGIVLRWRVVRGALSYVDVDEATVGLQAADYLSGPSVFFPGQPYGGAMEAPFSAVLASVGADGPVALKLVPILFHLAAVVVTWRVAVRVVPGRLGQLAAPILLWCGPAYAVWSSTKAHGFYGAALLLAASVVLSTLRVDERPDRGRAVILGVTLGLSCWATPLLALVAVPALTWLAVRRSAAWRLMPWVVLGAIVAATPWLAWNVRNDWRSLQQTPSFGSTAGDRFADLIDKLPAFVGLATPFEGGRALLPAVVVLTVIVLVVVVALAALRTKRTAPALLAVLFVGYLALYPFVNATASVGPDLRYLTLLLPVLAVTVAALLPDVRRAGWAALAGVVVVVGAMSWWGIVGMEDDDNGNDLFRAAPGLDAIADRLVEVGVKRVITDAAGYQITFATDGQVRGSMFQRPRFAALERVSLVDEPSTYVLLTGPDNVRFEDELRSRGVGFSKEIHGVWVLYRLDGWLPPWEAGFRLFFGVPVPRPSPT